MLHFPDELANMNKKQTDLRPENFRQLKSLWDRGNEKSTVCVLHIQTFVWTNLGLDNLLTWQQYVAQLEFIVVMSACSQISAITVVCTS